MYFLCSVCRAQKSSRTGFVVLIDIARPRERQSCYFTCAIPGLRSASASTNTSMYNVGSEKLIDTETEKTRARLATVLLVHVPCWPAEFGLTVDEDVKR